MSMCDFLYFWLVIKLTGCGILLGWVLAWRHFDKYGSVGVPFVRRDWPRKRTGLERPE